MPQKPARDDGFVVIHARHREGAFGPKRSSRPVAPSPARSSQELTSLALLPDNLFTDRISNPEVT